jgi:hypothetical protein
LLHREDGDEKKEEKSAAAVTGVAALLTDPKLSAHIDVIMLYSTISISQIHNWFMMASTDNVLIL